MTNIVICRLFAFIGLSATTVNSAILNRYHPIASANAESLNIPRTFPLKLEILASHKANSQMKQAARQAIIDNFTGKWSNTGYESHYIGKAMEKKFYGYWMVGIFDADFDVAYTIIRRSPCYLIYAANDRTILIAKEGNGEKSANPMDSPLI